MEFTQTQTEVLQQLIQAGFRPLLMPRYEKALGVQRGECAALLAPVEDGGLRLMAPVTLLVAGNLSVRLKKPSGDVFVWKNTELPATRERLGDLEKFGRELQTILENGNL